MSTPPRNLPRFLPTLTEVVHPSSLSRPSVAAAPDIDETVQAVLKQVHVVLERRLSEEINVLLQTLMAEQRQTLSARLHEELEIVVRQAVSEFMHKQVDLHKHEVIKN
jgi:hypothetical protein